MTVTDIIPRDTAEALAQAYQDAARDIREGYRLLQAAEEVRGWGR